MNLDTAPTSVLHVDMNSFFASVELLDHPELTDRPVAVGGDKSRRRGIVLAKNEPAKQFGVKTAETLWAARQKCPGLVVLPPHFEKYRHYSRLAQELYFSYTDKVEPLGLDECWLDVTGQDGPRTAERIRLHVKKSLGLTVSIGVSWNKIFAKLGSDYRKPDAVTVIDQQNFRELLWPLPVARMFLVGRTTAARLNGVGIYTIGELARTDESFLRQTLGRQGSTLWKYANGLDDSPVTRPSERDQMKSIGNSTTLEEDAVTFERVRDVFVDLAVTLERRMKAEGVRGATLQITVRDNQFRTTTRQKQLPTPSDDFKILLSESLELFKQHYDLSVPIRLLGITMTGLSFDDEPTQMTLTDWLNEQPAEEAELAHRDQPQTVRADLRRRAWDDTVRQLQEKLGTEAIRRASSLTGRVSAKYAAGEGAPPEFGTHDVDHRTKKKNGE
ncbi:MAG: DNA polymerase IV [Fastidiosipilaceae bacterium]